MEVKEYAEGIPSWVDLSSSDIEGSRRFYAELLGWTVEPGPPETGGYSNATVRGLMVAGVGPQMDPNIPPHWTAYVNVGDADSVAGRVSAAGGTMAFGPDDVMEFGRLGLFFDPTGAALGLWEPKSHRGAGLVNEPGAFCWNELVTSDTAAAKAFYHEVFGWDAVTHGEGAHEYTEFQVGGNSIAGMMPKQPDMPAETPSLWGIYFAVDDISAALEKTKSLGGTAITETMETPQGSFAVVADQVGAIFSVIQLATPS